jgi:hypothetical protein
MAIGDFIRLRMFIYLFVYFPSLSLILTL